MLCRSLPLARSFFIIFEQRNHIRKDMEKKTASFVFEQEREKLQRSFTVMVKTTGPVCNLDCDYCYYLEKDALYPGKKFTLSSFRMNEEVLEKLIRDYIASQPQQKIEFVWHGGEPALLGIEYFRKALALQKKYADGKEISNSFQTNGTLITDEWAEFLAGNGFLCGLSIDGPEKFHDAHRRFPNGRGSWEKAVECARLFRKHGVEFNTMSVVNATNSKEPATVYEFLKSIGSHYMQFTPIAERIALDPSEKLSIVDNRYEKATAVMQENVSAADWGNFLCRIFDIWVKNDVGTYFVNYFDNTLAAYVGQQPALCSMAPYCGCSLAVEHNGDIYSCDHFVFEDYKLGNIFEKNIAGMAKSDRQLFFEQRKRDTLSRQCQNCPFIKACGGDCPKNRFAKNKDGEYISCLCEGFHRFFNHTRKHFEFMADELKHQRPPANIMRTKL